MLGRQRRTGDLEADTIVIKWDVDQKYSKVKSTRVTTESWKVGDTVSVKMPPPETKELTGEVIFFGSNAQAEHEVSKLSGSDDEDNVDESSNKDQSLQAVAATKKKPRTNLFGVKRQNSSVAIARQLAKKAKDDALLTSAQTVKLQSARPPAQQRLTLLKPTFASEETQDSIATFSYHFDDESRSQTFSSQAAYSPAKDSSGKSQQRFARDCGATEQSSSAGFLPGRQFTYELFTPRNIPVQAHHDCCVNILGKLDSMEKVLWARFDAMQEKLLGLTSSEDAAHKTVPGPVIEQTASTKEAVSQGGNFTSANQVQSTTEISFSSGRIGIEGQLVSSADLQKDLLASCSASNFAVKLVYRLFPEEERKNKNCCGKRGKDPLSPNRLSFIKTKTAMYFPSPAGTSEKDSWKQCKKVIDSYLRK